MAVDILYRESNGKDISPEGLSHHWGKTQLGIPEPNFSRLRAVRACDQSEKLNFKECNKALMDGTEHHDEGPETRGLAASILCSNCSIDFNGIMFHDQAPRAKVDHDMHYLIAELAGKEGWER